ncbi:unnamed protein product [Musa acuminata subsp. burmannicoides]
MKNNSLFANVDFADTPNLPTDFQLFQVLQEAFRFISKFAGSLSIGLSTQSDFNLLHKVPADVFGSIPSHSESCAQIKRVASSRQNLAALHFVFGSDNKYAIKAYLTKLASSTLSFFCEEVRVHHGFGLPILSLAAAFIPPFDNKSSKALANSITLESTSDQISGHVNQSHRKDYYHGCATLAASNINWKGDAIEPKTGIKFPTFLEDNFSLTTKLKYFVEFCDYHTFSSFWYFQVLVGIGSRSMRIIKLKSLKLYAFGLYVHPDSICEKLGSKYASVPVAELKNHSDFFEDLLRYMTKRLSDVYNVTVSELCSSSIAFKMCFGYNLLTQLFFTLMLLGMDCNNFNMSEKFSLQTDCPRKFAINLRNKNIINTNLQIISANSMIWTAAILKDNRIQELCCCSFHALAALLTNISPSFCLLFSRSHDCNLFFFVKGVIHMLSLHHCLLACNLGHTSNFMYFVFFFFQLYT